jgi:dTDP-glucose 4,6-dehydratase
LGNPDPISIGELAKEIIEITGSDSKIVFHDLPLDDPKTRKPDIGKAKKLINWSPIVSRDVGLYETVKYFQKILL